MRRFPSIDSTGSKPTRQGVSLKLLLLGAVFCGLAVFSPVGTTATLGIQQAFAQQGDEPLPPDDQIDGMNADVAPPPGDDQIDGMNADVAPPPGDDQMDAPPPGDDQMDAPPPADEGVAPADAAEIEPLNPGEAVVTRFSGLIDDVDGQGKPVKVIDINGTSASIIDIRNPGEPPFGQHWINEPQRMFVSAGEVGQVFGVAVADKGNQSPDIFLSATAAFGLHRTGTAPGATDWMAGMWGPDAGPGSIYRISVDNGYVAEKFADVKLGGRDNTGASLGNIAYDKTHDRLFVSDLETGMIHSLDATSGQDMGAFDHGATGRTGFVDVWSGQSMALDPVAFDPATSARIDNCPTDFSMTPACWNIADFRRRVWGLDVRQDEAGAVRLYYSVWGSDAFGNSEWAAGGDDRRNAMWSIAITDDGQFDTTSVRREFFMPAFWPSVPALGDKAGNSNAVSDVVFPECGPQNVMLASERGGLRNLGLDKVEPFSRPYESRVLRYEIGADNIWRPKGRYDVGFHDRSVKDGEPLIFANAAGGADFNYRIDENGMIDLSALSQSVWMTGDGLCSPNGACSDKVGGVNSDTSEVHGLQGTPADAVVSVEPATTPSMDALYRSYMIDTDINIDANGAPIAEELTRNDATKIGDVAIYQVCEAAPPLPVIEPPEEVIEGEILEPIEPPEDWPVHTLNMSHEKWASVGHSANRSWHRRDGSWHSVGRSWHWRDGSWHNANRSWHRREGSWHTLNRSWHWREGSWHNANRSWHRREGSWHDVRRSWHVKIRSFHNLNRSWDGIHTRNRSFHVRNRSWDGIHTRNRSFHVRNRSWDGTHVRNRSFHIKNRTWNQGVIPLHTRARSAANQGVKPSHIRNRSFHIKNRTWDHVITPQHTRARSNAIKKPQHTRARSNAINKPQHLRRQSQHDAAQQHTRARSNAINKPQHTRARSNAINKPQHTRARSNAIKKPQHLRQQSQHNAAPQHSRKKSNAAQGIHPPQQHNKRQSRLEHRG